MLLSAVAAALIMVELINFVEKLVLELSSILELGFVLRCLIGTFDRDTIRRCEPY
jgi:hypothetical protein